MRVKMRSTSPFKHDIPNSIDGQRFVKRDLRVGFVLAIIKAPKLLLLKTLQPTLPVSDSATSGS